MDGREDCRMTGTLGGTEYQEKPAGRRGNHKEHPFHEKAGRCLPFWKISAVGQCLLGRGSPEGRRGRKIVCGKMQKISVSRKKHRRKEKTGKMKKTLKNLAALFVMAAAVFLSGGMTAYAYVDEAAEEAPEPVIVEETPEETEITPFSVAGNGQLLDDISDDETKQFLTVQTKNGNTFFMVIDRSRNSENVYMLSLIDEHDLAEFIEEEEPEPEEEKPAVVVEEPKPEPVQEQPQPEAEKGGMGMGALFTIILLGAGSIGGYYYFKVWKPKREEEEAASEDLEFFDGGAYVNEDQENGQEEGENEEAGD